jgi:hypothetical protein
MKFLLVLTGIVGFSVSAILNSKFKITTFSEDWWYMIGLFALVYAFALTTGMAFQSKRMKK